MTDVENSQVRTGLSVAALRTQRGVGGTFAPFRYPAFRAIWIANLASNLGSMAQSVGAAWLMTELTASHRLIALVQASATVPILLLGVFAGAIADNFDRRLVMLAAQIGMLVVSAVLAAMTWAGHMTPWLLLGFTFCVGIGTALNAPAWQASVRQQVGQADLPQAITLNTISFNLARSVGPGLGGLLISLWNVSLAFAVNSVSYLALIVVLLCWRPGHTAPERKPMLPAIGIGLKFCAGDPVIRRVLARGLAIGFGVAGYQALVPAVVRGRLHGTEIDYGILLGLFGVGSICAALFIGRLLRRFGAEAVITVSTLGFILAEMVLAGAHSLVEAAPATFIAGAGWVTGLTTINVAMQLRSPDAIIGRCLSIYQAVTFGGMALGAWVWGSVADWQDLPTALHYSAAFLVISLIVLRNIAPMPDVQPVQKHL
ncbi:MAG: MFS transporter [Pseudomonadota bacterium]|nr:MFS transporter [Pseudomonadota bacterium]